MRWLGIAARAFEMLCQRANGRIVDLDGGRLADRQVIQHWAAEPDAAIQVHGALGVTDDTVLAYWYRHERAARIYDGADEVHKTTLGRRVLRRYATAAAPA